MHLGKKSKQVCFLRKIFTNFANAIGSLDGDEKGNE